MVMHNNSTDKYEVFVGGQKYEECESYEDAQMTLEQLVRIINE